jgi:hypothetical protein
MLTNKEEGLPEPDKRTVKDLEQIKKMDTLAEKLEQIGCETQFMIMDCKICIKDKSKNTIETIETIEKELYQLYGNMYYYMNYLRNLVTECPEPLKHSIVFADNDGNILFPKD